jgi:Flp pilus assembly protein TadD
VAFARRGRRGEAIEAYLKAIDIDSGFASPRTNLGLLYLGAGEIGAATRSFEAAAEIAPGDARLRYHLGMARFRSGQTAGAIAELRAALRLRPDYPKAQALLSSLLAQLKTE